LNAAQRLNPMKRPFPVTILGCLFIVAGLVGLVYHLSERPLDHRIVLVSTIRIIAVVGGVFLLLGHNWARWLVLAWLLFHVVMSAFHSLSNSIAHLVLLLVVGYFLLRPPASKYFQPPLPE
jgi:chromate transport protein ChrA